MNERFEAYLAAIGVPQVLRDRIERDVLPFYESTCPEEIEDIFVTDFIADDEGRRFENLWLFSTSYFMEAKNFVSDDNFDLASIPTITHWRVTKHSYDLVTASAASRMTVDASSGGAGLSGLSMTFRAAQENCDYLRDTMRKYILPRVPAG